MLNSIGELAARFPDGAVTIAQQTGRAAEAPPEPRKAR